MKKTLFIMTHIASGWEDLVEVLNKHPLLQIENSGRSYAHPDDVRELHKTPHKQGGAGAAWGDIIFHNKDFVMKRVMANYKLIFWSSNAEDAVTDEKTVKKLVKDFNYTDEKAWAYLGYRLDGMAQYYRRKEKTGVIPLWNPDLSKPDDMFDAIFS